VPFSVAELLLVAAIVIAVGRVFLGLREGRRRGALVAAAAALLADAVLAAGTLYFIFLILWGLNYRRQPFAETAGLDTRPATVAELASLSEALVEEANRLRESVAEDPSGVMRLRSGPGPAFEQVAAGYRAAAARYPALAGRCGRPKLARLSPVLARLGITGIYSPFTGEPHVNATLPDPELPVSAAHELAHERGFAREDEANYLGYLACRLSPDPDLRYAAMLSASIHAQNALFDPDRRAFARVEARRSAGVRRDIKALVAWSRRYEGPMTEVGERVNDAYLKAQGERAGVRSYGRMVDLLLAERRQGRENDPW
jgi:hypothetical protein